MKQALAALGSWWALERSPHAGSPRLEAWQGQRLRAVLRLAASVPFYRQALEHAGIEVEAVRGVSDLSQLPVVRRPHIQRLAVADRLVPGVDPRRCVERRTGGSSGAPLIVLSRPEDLTYETLVWLRTWRRLGLRWFDLQVAIKDPHDAAIGHRPRGVQALGLLRVEYLNIHESPGQLARQLAALRPDVLRAPPSILLAIASELRPEKLTVRPRLVFTTSERLDEPSLQILERAFAAPVHDCYGATEAGCIAWHCPRCSAYHVNGDTVLVEVLGEHGPTRPGETGEVVITNLFGLAMPFVRYAIGDLAEVGTPCPAAPQTVTLRAIQGRSHAPLIAADGTALSPYSFMPDEIPGIVEYRIVQKEPGRVRVLVLPGTDFDPTALERARRAYQQELGRKCIIEFELREAPFESEAPKP